MPVILPPDKQDAWMANETPVETLQSFLAPYPPDEMQATPVSTAVISAKYDGPELIRALPGAGEFRLEG